MKNQSSFIANIHTVYKEVGKEWLEKLTFHIAELANQWDFRFIHPLANLTYHYVALVELNLTKEIVILKMGPIGSNIVQEAQWLCSFHHRVPRVLNIDENRNAFLMEYLTPGDTLKSLVQKGEDDAATRIISQTILELHRDQDEYPSSYKHLADLMPALSQLKGLIDNGLLSKAQSLFLDLTLDRTQDVLLHGDLHHDNILLSGDTWKVIDPHGYIGSPIAEIGPMIHNHFDCFPCHEPMQKIIETRLKILCEMLPYDPKSIQAWAFCLTMLSTAWDFEDNQKVNQLKIEEAIAVDSAKL
ncbi:MAG: phosphotransferase [Gammaproteobacteria bacterium]|nr:phosphotransferase [Gammaproteobacteria bacterium]